MESISSRKSKMKASEFLGNLEYNMSPLLLVVSVTRIDDCIDAVNMSQQSPVSKGFEIVSDAETLSSDYRTQNMKTTQETCNTTMFEEF